MSDLRAGRYRIGELLGGGATALVHRARDLASGTDVAIKELRPQFAGQPATRRRFLREAEAARALDHPGIVRLLEAHDEGDRPFLVMELVQGETLRARLARDGALGEAAAVRIAAALADALDHAHRRGIIHRDVKPENVFLLPDRSPSPQPSPRRTGEREGTERSPSPQPSPGRTGEREGTERSPSPQPSPGRTGEREGTERSPSPQPSPGRTGEREGTERSPSEVKLGDFGQARVTSLASLTGASLAWGTPEYMAPEAFARGRLDPRADLYALGVLLFEVATGRLPFPRAEALSRIGRAIAGTRLALPRTGGSPALDELLAELLAPAPSDRPESAAAVAERLRRAERRTAMAAAPCTACGAALRPDLPLCLGCGQATVRFAHTVAGRWRVILRHLDDDAKAMGHLLELLGAVARPTSLPTSFLVGEIGLYAPDEQRASLALPAVLFSDLDEETARALERLFTARGLDVVARAGSREYRHVAAVSGANHLSSALATVFFTAAVGRVTHNLEWGLITGAMAGLAALTTAGIRRRRRMTRPAGAFTLRERQVAVPLADGVLAETAAVLGRLRGPETRLLFADLVAALYRLARRQLELAPAGSRPRAPVRDARPDGEGLGQAIPALARRMAATALRLDALDAELERVSEGELAQELGRIERRLGAAAGAEREALLASRRDVETALDRRHAKDRDHERLSSALCLLLGRLRDLARAGEPGAAPPLELAAPRLEAAVTELERVAGDARDADAARPPF